MLCCIFVAKPLSKTILLPVEPLESNFRNNCIKTWPFCQSVCYHADMWKTFDRRNICMSIVGISVYLWKVAKTMCTAAKILSISATARIKLKNNLIGNMHLYVKWKKIVSRSTKNSLAHSKIRTKFKLYVNLWNPLLVHVANLDLLNQHRDDMESNYIDVSTVK